MQGNPIDAIALGGAAAHDLSILGLFLQADIIVKVVMLLLLLASFWSWAVIFDKLMRLRRLRRDATTFEESFWSGGSLDDLYDRIGNRPLDPLSAIFAAAMREWRRSAAKGLTASDKLRASLQDRIERVMDVTIGREMERLERFMSYLATVGSTAVFMVAAPLLTVGVPVDLPKAQAPAINENKEPLVVSVNSEGKIYLQETALDADDTLIPRLQAI